MPNFNLVVIVGHLTRDPVLRYLPSQTPLTEFAIAVNRRWTGNDGQKKEEVGFFEVTSFGKQAEVINQHLKKGDPLLVSGRLSFQAWTNKEGQNRSRVFITLENFQFLAGARPRTPAPAGGNPPAETQCPENPDQEPPPREDDIPF